MTMHQEPIRIYLVEETSFKAQYGPLSSFLKDDKGFSIVAETGTLLASLYQMVKPQVFLLAIRVFTQDTYDSIRRVKLAVQDARIVVVSDNDAALMQAAQAGIHGCISVTEGLKGLNADLRSVYEGNVVVSGKLALKLIRQQQDVYETEARYAHLTEREKDILHYLSFGMRNVEIGHHLGISDRTVQYHVGHIMRKLACRNRSELTSYVSHVRGVRDVR